MSQSNDIISPCVECQTKKKTALSILVLSSLQSQHCGGISPLGPSDKHTCVCASQRVYFGGKFRVSLDNIATDKIQILRNAPVTFEGEAAA